MNYFLHFYLAHFLSDYPFQSGRLVKFKQKRFLGVLIHSSIHLITMLVLLFPLLYEKRVWLAIAIVYLTHNLVDQTKVKLDKANPKLRRLFYFLDQFTHWTIIYVSVRMMGEVQPLWLTGKWLELYQSDMLLLYLLVLTLSTYFYDVTRYFVLLKMDKGPYQRDYKMMIRNAVIVTVAFGIYWVGYLH